MQIDPLIQYGQEWRQITAQIAAATAQGRLVLAATLQADLDTRVAGLIPKRDSMAATDMVLVRDTAGDVHEIGDAISRGASPGGFRGLLAPDLGTLGNSGAWWGTEVPGVTGWVYFSGGGTIRRVNPGTSEIQTAATINYVPAGMVYLPGLHAFAATFTGSPYGFSSYNLATAVLDTVTWAPGLGPPAGSEAIAWIAGADKYIISAGLVGGLNFRLYNADASFFSTVTLAAEVGYLGFARATHGSDGRTMWQSVRHTVNPTLLLCMHGTTEIWRRLIPADRAETSTTRSSYDPIRKEWIVAGDGGVLFLDELTGAEVRRLVFPCDGVKCYPDSRVLIAGKMQIAAGARNINVYNLDTLALMYTATDVTAGLSTVGPIAYSEAFGRLLYRSTAGLNTRQIVR